MRDPKRIATVLEALRQAWEQQPDLRLGQLLVIAAMPREPCPELFNVEDQVLLQGLESYQGQIAASRREPEEVEVVLGAEFDSALLKQLRSVVEAAGGHMSEAFFGVGGSQEITRYDVVLPAGKLVATSETYIGLSIRGSAALVQEVCLALQSA